MAGILTSITKSIDEDKIDLALKKLKVSYSVKL